MVLAFFEVVIAGIFFIVTPSWWQPRLADWLVAPQTYQHSDAIIVLGGDTVRRAKTGISLFKADIAPRLVITGNNPSLGPDSEQAQALAVADGVPANAITLVSTMSTLGDGQQIAKFASDNNLRAITIVTNWFHSRRAMCTIKQTVGDQKVDLYFVSAQTPVTPQTWWGARDGESAVLAEFVKSAYYVFVNDIPVWNCWAGDMNSALWFGLLFGGGLFSFGIVLGVQHWASRHLLDIPNERSSHSRPTPRGGGLGIVVMTLLPFSLWVFSAGGFPLGVGLAYLGSSALIAALGWTDDRASLSAKVRLSIQMLLAGVLLVVTGAISSIEVPLLGSASLGNVVGFGMCLFWMVGLTNAYNFMDGIDGLAGTQAAIAGLGWCFLLLMESQPVLALLAGLVATTSLGFLALNAPPAMIFMGDVGSTFLGFTLAAIPILAYHQTQNPRLLITSVLIVAPFAFDSALTVLRRVLKRENIFEPHRSHLYQRLIKMGYSHRQVTGLYMILCAISALCGALSYAGSGQVGLIAVMVVALMCIGLALGVNYLEAKRQPVSQGVLVDEVGALEGINE